jgi:TRAP-type C4-dicarboxylate transport system substrate-binding protein
MTEKDFINYVSDGFYNYLKHLLHSPKCRQLIGLDYNTVLIWFRRLDEARRRFIQHVGADPQRGRWSVNQDTNRNYTAEGIEEGSVIILKAKALEVSDAKLERFEERLEKLMQEIDRAKEGIRNLIRSHRRI